MERRAKAGTNKKNPVCLAFAFSSQGRYSPKKWMNYLTNLTLHQVYQFLSLQIFSINTIV